MLEASTKSQTHQTAAHGGAAWKVTSYCFFCINNCVSSFHRFRHFGFWAINIYLLLLVGNSVDSGLLSNILMILFVFLNFFLRVGQVGALPLRYVTSPWDEFLPIRLCSSHFRGRECWTKVVPLSIFGMMLPYKWCDSDSQSWPCWMGGYRPALHPLFLTISFVLISIHLVTGSTE